MKILIDINHPAHVHYFRNFIKLMEAKGHQFCVINRDSKMINQLLDYYGIAHTIRNKRPDKKGTFASMMNLLRMTLWCIRKSFSFRPDMYVGFANIPCAISSRLFRKPCVLLNDTEHNLISHKIYMPNCDAVLTPFYFETDLDKLVGGKKIKQVRFNGYIEQLYLHSKDYRQNDNVLNELNVKPREYVIVRYIAYNAHHDKGIIPLSHGVRRQLVAEISLHYKVFVSLEEEFDMDFYSQYLLNISPEKMHDLMAEAKFLITEGATMASEAFVLGVPYLYLNPLKCGNIDYQCNHYPERCFQTTDAEEAKDDVKSLMQLECNQDICRREVETETIRPTEYLCWFVENFPKSRTVMKENPDYQYKFR